MPVSVSRGTLNSKREVYSTISPEGSHLNEWVRDSRLRLSWTGVPQGF